MSLIKVDQIEALDAGVVKNVATLIDDFDAELASALITTDTGTQTIVDALNDRAIESATIPMSVTVGPGGDHATVAEAIEELDGSFRAEGQQATITLLTGFVWAEQVIVENRNLSYITITADDPEVVISREALTQTVEVDGIANRFPAIAGTNFCTLPIIDVLFNMDVTGAPQFHTGILVNNGSKVVVRPGGGVKNSTFEGIAAINGSFALTPGGVYTGCGTQADSPTQGAGVTSWNNSRVNANGADASNSYYGFRATVASFLSFRNATANSCARHNARADEASVISGFGATLQSAGSHGVNCWRGSIAFVEDCDVRLAAESGIRSWNGSTVVARGVRAFNCTQYGVSAFDGGVIDISPSSSGVNSNCNGAGITGILADRGSRIFGNNVSATGCPIGINADRGSTVSCAGANTNNATNIAVRSFNGAKVSVRGSTGTGATNDGLHAVDGGVIEADASDYTGAGGRGAVASAGDIYIRGSALNVGGGTSPDDIVVLNGGIIRAAASGGGGSVSFNTISAAGIIFK